MKTIGFGGGCHWCTEAVFQSLIGVDKVEQGWMNSIDEKHQAFSEAILVHFDPAIINLKTLIEVHLHTHSSTSAHKMRGKYRSAIYIFSESQKQESLNLLEILQDEFEEKIITNVLPFNEFKLNKEDFLNYYKKNPDKPFCKTYIDPKLELIQRKFSKNVSRK